MSKEIEELKAIVADAQKRIEKLESSGKYAQGGCVYKENDWVFCVTKEYNFIIRFKNIDGGRANYSIAIFETSENSNVKYKENDWASLSFLSRIATNKEVEGFLITEAKRRGFKEGVMFRCLEQGEIRPYKPYNEIDNGKGIKLTYLEKDEHECERLWTEDGLCIKPPYDELCSNPSIYRDGKWAEIVKDTKIEIGGYEVKFNQTINSVWYSTHIDGFGFTKEFWQSAKVVAEHSKACVQVGCSHQFKVDLKTINDILAKL